MTALVDLVCGAGVTSKKCTVTIEPVDWLKFVMPMVNPRYTSSRICLAAWYVHERFGVIRTRI